MLGSCKWFDRKKGFGFIRPKNGGADVFVHQSEIRMGGFRYLKHQEEVCYNRPCAAGVGYERDHATDVQRIGQRTKDLPAEVET